MMRQTSIADGSDKASPYAKRRWQNEIWDPTEARDEVPDEQEDGEGGKSKSKSFGHVFSEVRRSFHLSTLHHRSRGRRLEHITR